MKMLMQHVHAPAAAAVAAHGAADPARARRARAGVPAEGPEHAAAERRGAAAHVRRVPGVRELEPRSGEAVVGNPSSRADGPAHDCTFRGRNGRRARWPRCKVTRMRGVETFPLPPRKTWLDRSLSLITDVRAGEGVERAAPGGERFLPARVLFGAEDRPRGAHPERVGRRRGELRGSRAGTAAAGVRSGVRRVCRAREPRVADLRRHALLRLAPAHLLCAGDAPASASASRSTSGSACSTWSRSRSSGRSPTTCTTTSAASACSRSSASAPRSAPSPARASRPWRLPGPGLISSSSFQRLACSCRSPSRSWCTAAKAAPPASRSRAPARPPSLPARRNSSTLTTRSASAAASSWCSRTATCSSSPCSSSRSTW